MYTFHGFIINIIIARTRGKDHSLSSLPRITARYYSYKILYSHPLFDLTLLSTGTTSNDVYLLPTGTPPSRRVCTTTADRSVHYFQTSRSGLAVATDCKTGLSASSQQWDSEQWAVDCTGILCDCCSSRSQQPNQTFTPPSTVLLYSRRAHSLFVSSPPNTDGDRFGTPSAGITGNNITI